MKMALYFLFSSFTDFFWQCFWFPLSFIFKFRERKSGGFLVFQDHNNPAIFVSS